MCAHVYSCINVCVMSAYVYLLIFFVIDYNYSESLSTLQFANRAKNIKNTTRKNEVQDTYDMCIKSGQFFLESVMHTRVCVWSPLFWSHEYFNFIYCYSRTKTLGLFVSFVLKYLNWEIVWQRVWVLVVRYQLSPARKWRDSKQWLQTSRWPSSRRGRRRRDSRWCIMRREGKTWQTRLDVHLYWECLLCKKIIIILASYMHIATCSTFHIAWWYGNLAQHMEYSWNCLEYFINVLTNNNVCRVSLTW